MRPQAPSSHVTEPDFTGVSGLYIDMSTSYDSDALAPLLPQFRALNAAYKADYAGAYALLSAAGKLRSCLTPSPSEGAAAAFEKLADDAVPGDGARGPVREIFLSAVNAEGYLPCTPGAELPVLSRIWVRGSDGAEALFMAAAEKRVRRLGLKAILCRNPYDPRVTEHILLPGGPALLSGAYARSLDAPFDRVVNLDGAAALLEPCANAEQLTELARKAETEAVALFRSAKRNHDALEAAYRPYVDFSVCDKLAKAHIRALQKRL